MLYYGNYESKIALPLILIVSKLAFYLHPRCTGIAYFILDIFPYLIGYFLLSRFFYSSLHFSRFLRASYIHIISLNYIFLS